MRLRLMIMGGEVKGRVLFIKRRWKRPVSQTACMRINIDAKKMRDDQSIPFMREKRSRERRSGVILTRAMNIRGNWKVGKMMPRRIFAAIMVIRISRLNDATRARDRLLSGGLTWESGWSWSSCR